MFLYLGLLDLLLFDAVMMVAIIIVNKTSVLNHILTSETELLLPASAWSLRLVII